MVFVPGVMGSDPGSVFAAAVQPLEEVVVTDTRLEEADGQEPEDYDPWERFNDRMFTFNYKVDRYVIKPAAKAYDVVIPDGEKQLIQNLFDHVAMPKRLVNNLLQGKVQGAGREIARFFINSTLGMAGMTDVAKYQFGIEKSDEDSGQTLALHGWRQSRYLVLPFLSPLTARDAVGYVFDLALDPINYFIPVAGGFGRKGEDVLNGRAQNLEVFESVEEATVDLYSAVRNAYFTRREKQIEE
jgi:phospholipid-binding lipoprotein MlaA